MNPKILEAVAEALSAGYQLHPDAIDFLEAVADRLDITAVLKTVLQGKTGLEVQETVIMKKDLESAFSGLLAEEEVDVKHSAPASSDIEAEIEIVKDPTNNLSPLPSLEGYRALFESRLHKLYNIVKERPDAYQIQPISRLKDTPGQNAKIAGLVMEKQVRRNSTTLTIDDETGSLDVFVTDPDVKKTASELLNDQLVIADIAFTKSGGVVARNLFHPDVPDRKPGFSKKRLYAVLTSDIHVGSKTFLLDAFQRFVLWLSGRLGDEYIASRVKYVVVAGDVVDGVGIYPNQDKDLEETDVKLQFSKLAQLLEQIPVHIKILLTPGNHDPVRQALPQPAFPKSYAEPLFSISNITMLGSPSYVRLHGVNILIYHGRSLDDVVATTPGLSYAKPAAAMKLLLKARHLAPVYGGRTPLAPEREDHLVIDQVPDVFHAGHVHVVDRDNYRGTLILNSGAWQAKTSFQEYMGIEPTPGIVPIVDLSSLEVITRDFTKPLR